MGNDTKHKLNNDTPTLKASDEDIDRLTAESESPGVRVCGACLKPPETDGEFCGHCGAKLVTIRKVPDFYIDEVIGEKFRIVRKIGAGGMGEVYLAVNDDLQQKVAVKFLNKRFADDENVVLRFLNEARSYCRVNHPNAVTLLEFGQHTDGALYIITEYIEGKSITETLKAYGPLSVEETVDIGIQIGEVLEAAHEQGVIHRDLKPDNIMLIRSKRGRYNVKVLDFGIAKIVDDDQGPNTETGSVFGTPEFMSPEQARGDVADPRSDIYAFGIILFYVLTGRLPFRGDNKLVVLNKQLHESPPRPSDVREEIDVPEAFEKIISCCLEKESKYRYQTAEELLAALEQYRIDGSAFLSLANSAVSVEEPPTETPEVLRLDTVRFGEAHTMDAGELNTPFNNDAKTADLKSVELWREVPTSGKLNSGSGEEHHVEKFAVVAVIAIFLALLFGGWLYNRAPEPLETDSISAVLTDGQVLGMLAAAEQLIESGRVGEARKALDTTYVWSQRETASENTETRREQISGDLKEIEALLSVLEEGVCGQKQAVKQLSKLSPGAARRYESRLRKCRKKPVKSRTKPTAKPEKKPDPPTKTKKPVVEKPAKKPPVEKKHPVKKEPVAKEPASEPKENDGDGLPPKILAE